MNNCKILGALAAALLIAAMSSVAVGQDKATPQEVVAQLMEAASTLSKTGDLTQFNQEPSLRVWKDTYIFALDCKMCIRDRCWPWSVTKPPSRLQGACTSFFKARQKKSWVDSGSGSLPSE